MRENVAFVPGAGAFLDGRGRSSMRLNFSASAEDEIREGIRRIGEVITEQIALYGTLTGIPAVTEPTPAPAEPAAEAGGADVVDLPRRADRDRRAGGSS